jgi:hypothetical protein
MKRPDKHHVRKDDGRAFMPDPESGHARSSDTLAEGLAESFLASATSGEEQVEDVLNALVAEELGGPFLEESLDGDLAPIVVRPPPAKRRHH